MRQDKNSKIEVVRYTNRLNRKIQFIILWRIIKRQIRDEGFKNFVWRPEH